MVAVTASLTSSFWATPGLTTPQLNTGLFEFCRRYVSAPTLSRESEARCLWPSLYRCAGQPFLLYGSLSLRKSIYYFKIRQKHGWEFFKINCGASSNKPSYGSSEEAQGKVSQPFLCFPFLISLQGENFNYIPI